MTDSPTILFVTEANANIGYGHITRCSALAQILLPHFSIKFYVFGTPEMDSPFDLHYFNDLNDVLQSIVNEDVKTDAVVLDSYKIDNQFVNSLHSKAIVTVSINDLPKEALNTNVVINHTIDIQEKDFSVSDESDLFLGEPYTLLRGAFLEEKLNKAADREGSQVFICFGGADPFQLSQTYLEYLHKLEYQGKVAIVTNNEAVKEAINKYTLEHDLKSVRIYSGLDARAMIKLIRASTIAIVPSSTISMECMCSGIDLITGYFAQNQSILAGKIHERSLGYNLGDFREASLEDFKGAMEQLESKSYVSAQKSLFSSNSKRNLLEIFNSLRNGK